MLFHNSRDLQYRAPQGAVPCGSAVTLRARSSIADARVLLRTWWAGNAAEYEMRRTERDLFEIVLDIPAQPGLMWYYFIEDCGASRAYYGNAADGLGGSGQMRETEPPSFQITVYDSAFKTPEWMREGIMYQVMVDRFCEGKPRAQKALSADAHYHKDWNEPPELNSGDEYANVCNDFYGGDLEGLRKKLPYLSRLGVTVLYLNPIFRSRTNHKYDTGDYESIDPGFGTLEDFRALCRSAKRVGIRIVLDGVFSHVGSDSRYFNREGTYPDLGAYQSPKSPYYPWFDFRKYPGDYDCWWGFKSMPNVREMEPSHYEYIVSGKDAIASRYLEDGAYGWRLDVADELPMDFIRGLRRRVKEKNGACLIGEVWEDPSNKVAYGETRSYCLGDTLDSTMNYPLRNALLSFMLGDIDAHALVRQLDSQRENLPAPFYYSMLNLLGSHDRPRVINVFAGEKNLSPIRALRRATTLSDEAYALGKKRFIAVFRFLCALPGMPSLYYGDEAGMQGMDDPFNRAAFPWGREDTDLTRAIHEIFSERHHSHALKTGMVKFFAASDDVVCALREIRGTDAFGKKYPHERVLCVLNRAETSIAFDLFAAHVELDGMSSCYIRL